MSGMRVCNIKTTLPDMSIHACWKETKRPTLYSFCAFNPLLVLRSHSCSCVNYCHLVMCDIGTRWRSGHCVFLLYSNVGLGHWFQYPLMVPLSISCIKQPCMFVHRHIVLFKHCAGALQTPFKILDPPHHGILGRHLGRIQDYGLGSGYVGLSNAVDASRISYVAFCLGLTKNCLLLRRSGMPVPPDHSATHLGSFNPARAGTAKCIARKTDLVPLVVRSCCGGGRSFRSS